jgi:peptidoglycan/xylan/chitin deacetylase (PgdA/CDA1 family)
MQTDDQGGPVRWTKQVAEALLSGRVATATRTRRLGGGSLILAYHNILPPQVQIAAGDRSLHLGFDAFRRQLDSLLNLGGVVPVAEAMQPGEEAPRVSITFDDAYAGALDHGIPELVSRGLPATVFVAPGLLGTPTAWWDSFGESGLTPAQRTECLEHLAGDGAEISRWASAGGYAGTSHPTFRIATEAELLELSRRPGITLAAHTWSHPNLTRVPDQRLKDELVGPLVWLKERVSTVAQPWLAYPYGLFDQRVDDAAAAAGYTLRLAVTGGWFRPKPAQTLAPRFNVPAGVSSAGFTARLNGFLSR